MSVVFPGSSLWCLRGLRRSQHQLSSGTSPQICPLTPVSVLTPALRTKSPLKVCVCASQQDFPPSWASVFFRNLCAGMCLCYFQEVMCRVQVEVSSGEQDNNKHMGTVWGGKGKGKELGPRVSSEQMVDKVDAGIKVSETEDVSVADGWNCVIISGGEGRGSGLFFFFSAMHTRAHTHTYMRTHTCILTWLWAELFLAPPPLHPWCHWISVYASDPMKTHMFHARFFFSPFIVTDLTLHLNTTY